MPCCAECFGDRGLRKSLIRSRPGGNGDCTFCGSTGVRVVEPAELTQYFELVVGAYEFVADGKTLLQLLREDWRLFQHVAMTDEIATALLSAILGEDFDVGNQKFASPRPSTDRVGAWEALRDELMHRNRFFPDANIDLDRLGNLIDALKIDADEITSTWYRARIQTDDMPYPIDKMGPPPRKVATHGRANPAGIPYLYLGSKPETAIPETRPHTGQLVCVADYTTPNDLRVVDLRDPRRVVSPFELEDASDVVRLMHDLPFLERLGEELTRPVLPQAAAIDYTPSQYLCEFIKKRKYDGVLYRSAVSDGINLALFETGRAAPGAVVQYRVTRVSAETQRVTSVPSPPAAAT